ncbi:Peptidase S8, subtilisin-related [Trema orientale]|uniref:Peptidase S8, subtilisin-related n=1 Tax=Trema orientale TaxID=63057 RepID=A0A2P5FNK3_TREOI|nr:Peptidase S8, subtilisin-related [Trema orientale]
MPFAHTTSPDKPRTPSTIHILFTADNATEAEDYLSPRALGGHGTHTSTIATGSSMANQIYINGLGVGTVREGATQAQLAMFKVC